MSMRSLTQDGTLEISGEYAVVYVVMDLDETYGTLTRVLTDEGENLFTAVNPEEGCDWAENYADNGPGSDDDCNDSNFNE